LVGYIAQAVRARTLMPEYRLAPEHRFPAALEDCLAVYRELLDEGVAPEEIIIGGDSAGGGLALSTLVCLRDAGEPLPAAVVLLSPWVDLTGTGESMKTRANRDPWLIPDFFEPTAARYYGEEDPRHPLVSPLYADHHGLPPMFIQVGDDEILLSDAVSLAERAEDAGVDVTLEVWHGMWHVWQAFVQIVPESKEALERISNFVDEKLAQAEQEHEETYA
jgi:epsilon-lactone hydrolase